MLITAFVFTVGQANASPPSIEKKEQVSLNITKEITDLPVINLQFNSLQDVAVESNVMVQVCNENATELVNAVLFKSYYISPHFIRLCNNRIDYVQKDIKKAKIDNPHLEAPEIIDKNNLAIMPS